ncbi:Ribosome maturation protein sbds [Clonorchis sinensis]|uniref:Ribosome maturation protein sbds n=2 Tax=Clonorchis sinensis TaxID=79923 RepID=A0A8T1MTS7_CLOSI|nr:Ribosome maturation protein sbds [Clonorchis sinensis]GAA48539.1 ribosome maturation protein SDO1 [Clonorchis sinensis]
MALFTPTNQKRLTNVSVVRLKKGGNRYELACYPNKVRAWRDRLETNLDEVLQIQCVFTNVSKGQFANKKEMFQVFRTENEIDIIKLILEQGELQLTEKERSVEQQSLFRDVAKMVSERCVNPETNRAYTVTMIEKMMKDCHISLKANKTAKQHALEVIKHLRSTDGFKIAPAMMEVVVSIDSSVLPLVKDSVLQLCTDIIRQGQNADTGNYELTVVIEPEKYGAIESLLHSEIKGKYCIEIVGNTKHVTHRPATKAASDLPSNSVSNLCESPPIAPVESQLPVDGDAKPNSNQACPVEESSSAPVPELKSAVDRPKKPQRRKKRGKGKSRDDDWPDD